MDKRDEAYKWMPIASAPHICVWDNVRKEYLSAGTVAIVAGPGREPQIKIVLDGCRDVTGEGRFQFEMLTIKSQEEEWREPDENTPDDAAVWYKWSREWKHWRLDRWGLCRQDVMCVLAKEGQGPPPDDWKPGESHD